MAVDYFVKFEGAGIKGESPVEGMTDYLQIDSFSWGVSQSGTFSYGDGGGGGKANVQDMSISARMSKASAKIMEACANGSHIAKVTLVARKAGGAAPVEAMKIVLSEVLVSSYQIGGSGGGDDVPSDSFSLNFGKVDMTYKDQKNTGDKGADVVGGWDVKKGKVSAGA